MKINNICMTTAILTLLCQIAGAETNIEIGANITSGDFTESGTIILQERWRDKYGLSIGYIGEQIVDGCGNHPKSDACIFPVREQFIVGLERIFSGDRFLFRIGPYYFQNRNRISSCNVSVRLAGGYRITDRLSAMLSHFSNAGTCDEIEIENPPGTVHRGAFNMGYDGVFLIWRF